MRELDRTPTCRLYLALARFQLSPIRPSQDVRSFAHSGPRMQPRASLGEHLISKIRGLSNIPTEISAVTNCQVQLFSNHYPEHRTLAKSPPVYPKYGLQCATCSGIKTSKRRRIGWIIHLPSQLAVRSQRAHSEGF